MSDTRAFEQANAQMASVRAMVAALECDYDRLEELRDALQAAAEDGEFLDDSDREELDGLEEAAGDCEDREDAERRIHEDALSVEVRSGWCAPLGHLEQPDMEEFQILLCTGGPAVRIMGELSQGEPSRAWLEYQDWGTPWTERVNQEGDQDALLAYARCHYFGE